MIELRRKIADSKTMDDIRDETKKARGKVFFDKFRGQISTFVGREEVTTKILEHEEEIYRQQALESGKPENVVDRIVTGKMDKFYAETVLLEQPFVKDTDKTVGELLSEAVSKLGENLQIRRFSRFRLGEGIEKRADDFAEEVRQQVAS